MSVAGPERLPHLFVVDSQAQYAHLPSAQNSRKPGTRQMLLRLLGVFVLLAVFVEGGFIYYLYSKIQVGSSQSQIGAAEATGNLQMEAPLKTQQKPSAHLSGSTDLQGDIVQWKNLNSTGTFTYQMGYQNGRLMVLVEGLYYLYSKVSLDLSERCSSNQVIKIMRATSGYPVPFELLRSTRIWVMRVNRTIISCVSATSSRFDCRHNGRSTEKESVLGGLFHLKPNDEVYVTLSTKPALNQKTDGFLGAFMLY